MKKYSLDSFITAEMFLDLAGCTLLVCGSVELFKAYVDFSPPLLNMLISVIVTLVRLTLIGDFTFKGVVLGVFNLVPILLGSCGCYEFIKSVGGR